MKTTRRAIEHMPHLRWRIGAVACAGTLSLMCLPTSAWANAGTTQVTVEADPSSVIEYDVPTELPFYVAADGTLTDPLGMPDREQKRFRDSCDGSSCHKIRRLEHSCKRKRR